MQDVRRFAWSCYLQCIQRFDTTSRQPRKVRRFNPSLAAFRMSNRNADSAPMADVYNLDTCGLAERNRKGRRCQQFEAQMTNAANDVAAFAGLPSGCLRG